MRHILEHNYKWARVLDNALASFTQRITLILFTPERETTQQIAFQSEVGVPDIAFQPADITDRFRQAPSMVAKQSSSWSEVQAWERARTDPPALILPTPQSPS